MKPKVLGVIPARLHSTRFPKKVLHKIKGKPLVQWVWEGAKKSVLLDDLLVATDSEEVKEMVLSFGGKTILTSPEHQSGTDRLGEVALKYPEYEIIVNIQGDEPLIQGKLLDGAIKPIAGNKDIDMVSVYKKIEDVGEIENPNVVKVILDSGNFAIYFSRFPLPYQRNPYPDSYLKHIGLYIYRREVLLDLIKLPRPGIEIAESLEQLRALYYGYRIFMVETDLYLQGVDTPEDIKRVEELL